MVLEPILKWFMIIADSDGVGLNRLQFTMTTPIWRGCTPVFPRTSLMELKHTCAPEPGLVQKPELGSRPSKAGHETRAWPPPPRRARPRAAPAPLPHPTCSNSQRASDMEIAGGFSARLGGR